MKAAALVFGYEFKRSWKMLLSLFLAIGLFSFLMTAMYPQLKGQFDTVMGVVPSFIKPLLQSQMGMKSFEDFIPMGYTHPFMMGLFGVWAISNGASSIAGEIERGTLGWMLSYPIGRLEYLFGKVLMLVFGLLVMAIATLPGFWLGFHCFNLSHQGPQGYLMVAGMTVLLYGAIGLITVWASVYGREAASPAKLGAFILLFGFLLNYVAQLWEPLKAMRWLSLFAYYTPKALLSSQISGMDVGILAALMLISLAGACVGFSRRQLSI